MTTNYDRLEKLLEGYRYIITREEALEVYRAIGEDAAALDFETTGLDPRYSRVRLSCIYHPKVGVVLIDHDFAGAFNDLAPHMMEAIWIVYNAKFELRWFEHAKCGDVDMMDVDFLAKAVRGGSHSSLAVMARRDLRITLQKEEQLSDWSLQKLTTSQLDYAASDAAVTWMLFKYWFDKASDEQRAGAYVFMDAVSATVECETTGMRLDTDYHWQNIRKWEARRATAFKVVRRYMPKSAVDNPNSNKQVSDWLKTQLGKGTLYAWPKTEKTKQLSLNRGQIGPLAAKSPYPFSRFLNAFMLFRYYNKYLSTYGETLVTKQYLEGKITYRLNIGQAATGRYSSSSINIQNIPRAPWVRRAFLPPEGYKYLVVADYSGVEVRVLAELSQDQRLLHDAIHGDVHSGSASAIYKIDEQEFLAVINSEGDLHGNLRPMYKEMRSKAKGFTFQNIYGAAAFALSIVLKCSVAEAEEALRAWAARYPRAYDYRRVIFDTMSRTGYIPVCDGRQIFVPKNDRTTPVAANYGIQGAAASVMYRAMYHVQRLRNERSSRHLIPMVTTVHDELILACNDEQVDTAKALLEEGMKLGWLDIFPGTSTENLVEAGYGLTWGDAK